MTRSGDSPLLEMLAVFAVGLMGMNSGHLTTQLDWSAWHRSVKTLFLGNRSAKVMRTIPFHFKGTNSHVHENGIPDYTSVFELEIPCRVRQAKARQVGTNTEISTHKMAIGSNRWFW